MFARRVRRLMVTLAIAVGLLVPIAGNALAAVDGVPGSTLDPFTQTELDTNWEADRYFPTNGVTSVSAFGRDDVARLGLDSTDTQPGTFQRTEGIKTVGTGFFGRTIQVDLYLDPDWADKAVRAGFWVVGDNGAGARDNFFGIIEFLNMEPCPEPDCTNQGNIPVTDFEGFRVYDSTIGWSEYLTTSFTYGEWVTLEITLDAAAGQYVYSIDGVEVATAAGGSHFISEVFLNSYNFGLDAFPNLLSDDYSAHWHVGGESEITWTTEVVHPGDMNDWAFGFDSGANGSGEMVWGPGDPPAGAGSAFFELGDAATGYVIGTQGHGVAGVSFMDITALEYSTYRSAGGPAQAVALQFNVDYDLTDTTTSWQGRLVYEPYYTQTVLDDTWQTWDTLTSGANWWSTGTPRVGDVAATQHCTIGAPCTWEEVLTFYPNAGIHELPLAGMLLKAGSGWAGFEGNADELRIAVGTVGTVFDFDPFDGTNCIVDWQGTGHYLNLEPAINNPACEVIQVLEGTYVEGAPQVLIDRDVTIVGAGRDTTTIVPSANTTTTGDGRGWFRVTSLGDVHISGLTFDGAGYNIWQAFRHLGTGSFTDVAFENITFNPSTSYGGVAIAAFGGIGPVNVSGTTFENIGRVGVLYFGAGTTGEFSGNTYTGKGVGDWIDYALDISAGAVIDVENNTITMNRGTASVDGSGSAAILVSTFFASGTVANIVGNMLDDNTMGVAVGFDGDDSSTATLTGNTITNNDFGITLSSDDAAAASSANRNAIVGNDTGVDNGGAEEFDASCNWWGDASGPSGAGSGIGDSTATASLWVPWLESDDLSGPCTGNTITFDGVPADFIVEATGPTTPVTFTAPTAESLLDGSVAVGCVPASGDTHGLGDVEIVCTAEDSLGNEESISFTATVVDTTPPVIDPLDDLVAEATGPSGAAVSWPAPTANDLVDGSVLVVCAPPSGSLFPIGDTVVTCTATDASANESQATFTVTVEDTTGPIFLTPMPDKTVEATSAAGAHASWPTPFAQDVVDGARPVFCVPESGDLFPFGTTEVTCTSTDLSANSSQITFDVTVVDTTAPFILNPPSDQTLEATGPAGAAATWDAVVAYDPVAGATPVICDSASGVTFPLGDTLVTCNTTDGTNASSASFTITVEDTTPPVISGMPSDMLVEATGPTGAEVSWTAPTASDLVDGAVAVICDPASGSTFGFGATEVECTATDAAGNESTASFDVTVVDSQAPVISGMPADMIVEATGPTGAEVSWTAPTASDLVDGAVAVICDPASGSTFALGAHIVECTATDSETNSSMESFTVTVVDTTPPDISGMPSDITVQTSNAAGTTVSWTAPTAVDLVDGAVAVVCAPASGTLFAIGTTLVECTAVDGAANSATESFNVTVELVSGPVVRYSGPNRYATAAAVAQNDFPGEVDVVFIAVGTNFPDGLAASAAAVKLGAPVLLVQPNSIPAETVAELERLQPGTIVIVGGTAVVSQVVEDALGAYADEVVRRGGANRYETAVLVSAYAFGAGEPDEVIVVTGTNFPDALVGSAAAGSLGGPVLLVPTGALPAYLIAELERLDPDKITVIGGTSAVSASTFTALTLLATSIERIQGATRYETAANASAYAFAGGADRAYVAVGTNFPDALVGAAAAGKHGAPVLLVEFGAVPPQVADELVRLGVTQVIILGGPSAVSSALDAVLLAIITGG